MHGIDSQKKIKKIKKNKNNYKVLKNDFPRLILI